MHSSRSRHGLLLCLACGCLLWAAAARAQQFVVEPYLQSASPTGMLISWETTSGRESVVSFGTSEKLGSEARGIVTRGHRGRTRLHTVKLEGLAPNTHYYYRVKSGKLASDTFDMRTPAKPAAERRTRIVAIADTQWDFRQADKLNEITERGILRFASARTSPALSIDMLLVAGDLVGDGSDHRDWTEHFFEPLRKLMRHVPTYPVIGNHEQNHPLYFQYFELPKNGPPEYSEHFWWKDQGNVRVVGLDSNEGYRISAQLVWLDRVLASACQAEHVDFVVAMAHHPERAELWPDGEARYMGLVAQRLEQLSSACAKPTVLLTGHAHGYARGHSRDHALTMVSVATAAGSIDHFGEYARQQSYPEYVLSEDDYGFVVLEATAGDDPSLRIQRVSRGNERHVRDNDLRDEVLLYRNNQAPTTPTGLAPEDEQVDPHRVVLVASPFHDPDGDLYGATHWQLSDGSCNFATPLIDHWVQYSDVFAGKESVTKADEARFLLPTLRTDARYCFRVRMRDRSLAWSAWSPPQRFGTAREALARR